MKNFLYSKSLLIVATLAITWLLSLPMASSADLDSSAWYSYNGYSELHSYSIRFPQDWQVYTIDDSLQGFSPKESEEEDYHLLIHEFQNEAISDVVDFFEDGDWSLLNASDRVFPAKGETIIAKDVNYVNISNNQEMTVTIFNRGSLTVALQENIPGYSQTISAMKETFQFTDSWSNYLDFENKYSFIFPKNFNLSNLANGVEISVTSPVFSIQKYEAKTLDEAIDKNEDNFEIALSNQEIDFHTGEIAYDVTFKNTEFNKEFSRIFIKKADAFYVMTNLNLVENHPHPNTYDDYIFEMLESFYFFSSELDPSYVAYQNFRDVRDNHPNSDAINYLAEEGVVNGYGDGTFKPDTPLNRAELTKMLVASQLEPDPNKYKNCFPDVKTEWYALYICYAKEQGWVNGYVDKTFKPGNEINRVEAIKIILESMFDGKIAEEETLLDQSVLDVDLDSWYGKYFSFADNKDLLDKQHTVEIGEGYNYLPTEDFTRKELAESIYRIEQL